MKQIIIVVSKVIIIFTALFLSSCVNLPGTSQEGSNHLASFRLPTATEYSGAAISSTHDNNNIANAFQDFSADTIASSEDSALSAIVRQWELLQQFMDEESTVRTIRRGLFMETIISSITPPSFYELYGQEWDCAALLALDLTFTIGVTCQAHLHNERLLGALMEFTEICSDNIRINVVEEIASGMHPTRHGLRPSQRIFLEALEAYMDMVNAPFWYDMYANDPVITHIGLPNPNSDGSCDFFTVWLYDPAFLDLCNDELAIYTMDLRQEIIDFIGMDCYRFEFRINRCGADDYDEIHENLICSVVVCYRYMGCGIDW